MLGWLLPMHADQSVHSHVYKNAYFIHIMFIQHISFECGYCNILVRNNLILSQNIDADQLQIDIFSNDVSSCFRAVHSAPMEHWSISQKCGNHPNLLYYRISYIQVTKTCVFYLPNSSQIHPYVSVFIATNFTWKPS